MKKFISMLLSVLLVISSFIGVFTVTTVSAEKTTEETATELVSNGNFENSSLNPFDTNMGAFQNQWATADKIQQSLTSLSKGQWLRATGGAGYDPLDLLSYTDTTNGEGVVEETYVAATATDYAQYFSPCNRVIAQPDDNNDNKNHIARVNQTLFQAINIQNGQYVFKFKVRTNGAQNYLYVNLQGLQKGTESDTTYSNKFADSAYDKFNFKILKVASGNYSVIENKKSESINCAKIILDKPTEWTEVAFIAEVTKNANPTATKNTYAIVDTDEIDFTMLNFFYDSSQVNNNEIGKKYRKQGMYLDDISVKAYTNPFSDAMFYNKDGEVLDNTNEYVAIETTVNGDEVLGLSVGDKVTATLDYNTDCNVFAGWFKNSKLFSRDESIEFTVNSTDNYYPKFINKNLLTSSAASYENYAADKILVVTDRTKYPEVGEWGSTLAAGYYGKTYNEVIYDTDHKSYQQTDTGSVRSDVRNTVVDATKAYKGSKSLRLENNYVTFATGLGVKKNTNYTLTYYVTSTVSTTVKTGVLTTLNTANDVVPTPLDGGTAFMGSATGNLPAGATMVRSDVAVNSTEWKKITLDFNSGDFEKLYFVVAPSSDEGYWIDEVALVEKEVPETVGIKWEDAKGTDLQAEDTANIFANTAIEEDVYEGTKTVSIDYDRESGAYAFKGWSYNGTIISTDETYAIDTSSYPDLSLLKAVMISANQLSGAASFETYDDKKPVSTQANADNPDAPTGDNWKMVTYFDVTSVHGEQTQHYYSGSGSTGEATSYNAGTVTPRTGNVMLKFPIHYQTAVRAIPVNINTNYKLTFYVNAPDAYNAFQNIYLSTVFDYTYGASTMLNDSVVKLTGLGTSFYGSTYNEWKEWKKVELEFNSGNNTTLYLCLYKNAAINNGSIYNDCFIDDMSLVAMPKVDVEFVDTKGEDITDECTNEAKPTITNSGTKPGYFVANADYDDNAFDFKGWYEGDTLLSTDKSFEFANGAYSTLTAKVVSRNLLSSTASFEGYDAETQLKHTGTDYPSGQYFGCNVNAGYLGATFEETIYDNKGNPIAQNAYETPGSNGISALVKNTKAHSGKNSVLLENYWRTASLGIKVTPQTDYILSYYILAPKYDSTTHQNTIALSAISTTVNTGSNSYAVAPANVSLNSATNLYLDSKSLTDLHDGEKWIKVTHSFNSMNLDKVYLVIGQTTDNSDGYKNSWAYIDNMTMIKCDPATLTVDYMKSCASIDPVGCDLDNLFVDQNVQFKVIHNQANAPVVTANNTVITADSNGIYSFKANQNNTLSVRFDGDETLNDHDKGYNGEILSKYDKDVYLNSIWEGNTVYQEPALFVGETETKQLLYPVDKIVSLRSYDLKTNYVEGVDYKVTGDGKIQRLVGSRIPLYTAPLTTTTKPAENVFPLKDNENEYLCFIGDTVFPQYAVSVTYEHSTTFADGYTPAAPASQTEKLQKTIEKLEKGEEEVNIVIYGDSISTGRSSSGQNSTKDIYTANNKEGEFANLVINVAPYAPTWIDMFITELRERYPTATINLKNLSLGGMGSEWGAKNIAARLALWKDEEGNTITPDLMLIGFGVNDSAGNVTKAAYKNNIQNIISTARSGNQDMEVLLYSPMLPNQKATTWDKTKLIAYENALEEIAQEDTKIGLLKLTSIFTEIIKSKDCVDYLNTNVNHGNDFTARIYATGLLAAMSGESITEYLGTAIRTANGDKKQALRYKFSVSKDLINGNSDYGTLVEYGSVAIRSDYLEGAELIKDGKYKNSNNKTVTPVTGIAYSTIKTPNVDHIIYRETQTAYEFTAALYNIGYNKTTGATNYNAWGYDYSVRNYAIFKDANGNTNTVYDATIAVSSVFKVMNQIEYLYGQYKHGNYTPSSDSDRLKLENDYKTVQSILGDTNSEQSKAYQAWSNANVDDIPACTVTADTTDGDAGYVVRVGRSYFAGPYTGNEFIGWYENSSATDPFSTDTSLTIANINKNHGGTVVAKFKDNNLLSDIGAGAEKLTTAPTMYNTKAGCTEPPETGNYFYTKASWSDMGFTTKSAYVHSGSKAFSMLSRNQDDARIVVRGLKKKTQYGVSFWWKNQASGSEYYFSGMAAVPTTTTSWNTAKSTNLGGVTETVYTNEALDWNYTEFTFNTGDNTEVNLCYQYYAGDSNSNLVFDELTLYELPNQEDYITYNVSVSAENGVAYQSALNGTVKGNTSVNLVCSPNNQNAEFLGWYDGETIVSDSQTFNVQVDKDYNLTAKFTEGTKYEDTKSGDDITTALQETGYYNTLFERAIKNKGNQALIAKMLKKAQQGDDITIVGLGGSITQGAGATNKAHSYSSLVADWLRQQFPTITVNYYNAGIGATTSDLGLARMQAQVLNHNPDLVIVDFTTNDQNEERYRYTYEALIRKLMEEKVATVAIMFGSVVPESYSADKTCIRRDNRTNLHFPSLLYYDIPVIDYYGTIWDYLDSNGDSKSDSNDLAQWTKLWSDYIHPNNAGHLLSANAINYYLKTVLDNINSISNDLPVVPQELFYTNTASYIGSTMYDNSNIGAKLKGSSNVVIEDYGNVDANTQSQWKTWKISEGGYIEFTLPSCKSFTILRVQQPNGGKAKITINGKLFKQDNSYQSSGQLNWSSATYYGDGETPTTIRIECIDDGDNATNTFYQISCVFIAE